MGSRVFFIKIHNRLYFLALQLSHSLMNIYWFSISISGKGISSLIFIVWAFWESFCVCEIKMEISFNSNFDGVLSREFMLRENICSWCFYGLTNKKKKDLLEIFFDLSALCLKEGWVLSEWKTQMQDDFQFFLAIHVVLFKWRCFHVILLRAHIP
jgi:hypothetical protein